MNAISNLTSTAKILLAIFALATLVLIANSDFDDDETRPEIHRSSDYAMSDFTLTVMDIDGKPSRVIIGDEMAHYPEDDSTEIINPLAYFIEPGKETWVVSSNKGETTGEGENILLTGNVIITQDNNDEFELRTEALNLDTVYNTAYTDLAVTIKAPHGETHSVGLHAAMEDKAINLHSKVRGHYDAPTID